MLLQATLDALQTHTTEAKTKHQAFAQGPPVTLALRDRISKLEAAIGSTADPDQLPEIGRRLLQTATIALRAYEDLRLTANPPKTEPQ